MKKRIREKLLKVGQALAASETVCKPDLDGQFIEQCLHEFAEGTVLTIHAIAQRLQTSDDWALDTVNQHAPLFFRCGRIIRVPHSSFKAMIRAKLTFTPMREQMA